MDAADARIRIRLYADSLFHRSVAYRFTDYVILLSLPGSAAVICWFFG